MVGRLLGTGIVLVTLTFGWQSLALSAPRAHSRVFSPQSLKTKIIKAYPWADPEIQPSTVDGKQYSLNIFESHKPISFAQGVGATIMNLFITELKGQYEYRLTVRDLTKGGRSPWQYIYRPVAQQLTRYNYTGIRSLEITTWYITLNGIAHAAQTGHWPSNGVTKHL